MIGRFAAVPVTGYLLQILDPAETLLPYDGRIRFRGLEREGDTLIPRVETVRDAYARRLKAQQEASPPSAPPPGSASASTAPTTRRRRRC